MSKEVTMRDIAKEMNISVVSVSKAVSGREGVGEQLRERINEKAREMGYVYTSPKLNRLPKYTFCVLVSQKYISENTFYGNLYQSLVSEFALYGHACELKTVKARNEEKTDIPSEVVDKKVDGIILMGPFSKNYVNEILRINIPCVFLDNYTVEAIADCVVSDGMYGCQMLTNYLIEKGHKRIAFVGTIKASNSIIDRYLGFYKALIQNNIPLIPEYVLDDRGSDGYQTNVNIPSVLPDAFVCNCDEVAYHLINRLKNMGISVPKDTSVVGYDDYTFALKSSPQLTTFRIDMKEMSMNVADIMLHKMKDSNYTTGRRVISGEIVIRDSVIQR